MLVVGGGDGGILREIIKHPMVEEAHLCEIDEVDKSGINMFEKASVLYLTFTFCCAN